jgi:SPP1 family predicted phage head-tail adaptor
MPLGPIRKGAGQLRKRVALQSAALVVDALGGRTQVWTTYATVWAAVEPQPFVVGSQKAEVLTVITIRYRPDVAAEQQVVSEGKTYTVLVVIDNENRHRDLVLHCAEVA